MAWVANFPLGTTLISQSVGQFQANWTFLQTSINTDHFFNDTVTPVNEGHHRFVQMLDSGAIALAAGMSGVLSTQNMGATPSEQPFWTNATNKRQIPTLRTGSTPVVVGLNQLVDLNGQPNTYGILQMFDSGNTSSYGLAYVLWNGASTVVVQLATSAGITAITQSTTVVRVNTAFNGTITWALYTLPL